jgi:hypothetical protein
MDFGHENDWVGITLSFIKAKDKILEDRLELLGYAQVIYHVNLRSGWKWVATSTLLFLPFQLQFMIIENS